MLLVGVPSGATVSSAYLRQMVWPATLLVAAFLQSLCTPSSPMRLFTPVIYLTVTHKNPGTASADVPFVILVALEELLEMSGAALFFCSLLEYLEGISGEHVFRLKS